MSLPFSKRRTKRAQRNASRPNGATKSIAERKAKFMATAGGLPSGSKKLASQANGGSYNILPVRTKPSMTQTRTTLEPRRCFSRINSPTLSADPSTSSARTTSSAAFLSRLFVAVTSTASARKVTNRTGQQAEENRRGTQHLQMMEPRPSRLSVPFGGRRDHLSTTTIA